MISRNSTLRVFVAAFVAALFLTSSMAFAAGNCNPSDCKMVCKTECKDRCKSDDKSQCTTECKEKCTTECKDKCTDQCKDKCKDNEACVRKCSEPQGSCGPGKAKGKS